MSEISDTAGDSIQYLPLRKFPRGYAFHKKQHSPADKAKSIMALRSKVVMMIAYDYDPSKYPYSRWLCDSPDSRLAGSELQVPYAFYKR